MAFGLTNDKATTHKLYKALSTDIKPTANIEAGSQCYETDTKDVYEFDGLAWAVIRPANSGGVSATPVVITDAATTKIRHNRFIDSISATWPDNDTFSITWEPSEAVSRYRVKVRGGAAGDYVKVVEDAANEAQAGAWLTTATSSATVDVEYIIQETSNPVSATIMGGLWSEWQEFPEGDYLSRLDFLGSAAGTFSIWIEAE